MPAGARPYWSLALLAVVLGALLAAGVAAVVSVLPARSATICVDGVDGSYCQRSPG